MRRNKTETKREEPEVHGCPKRAAEGNSSENSTYVLSQAFQTALLSALLNSMVTTILYNDVNAMITFISTDYRRIFF